MSEQRPKDDDIVKAELAEEIEAAEARKPPGPSGPMVNDYLRRHPKKKGAAGLVVVMLLLIAVGAASFIYRKELTDLYDRLTGPAPAAPPAVSKREPGGDVIQPWQPSPSKQQPPREKTEPELPNPEVPHFEPRTLPEVPRERPEELPIPPPKEVAPGLAYSLVKRDDVSFEGVKQIEFKVVVPLGYGRDDLLRVGKYLLASELRLGPRHAIRVFCFRDPRKTRTEDAYAEVIWAPGGDFFRAADAVTSGSEKNEFKVVFHEPQ